MLAVNALETNPDLTDEEILEVLSSNLCRCTGYQNIVKAVRSTAADMRGTQRADLYDQIVFHRRGVGKETACRSTFMPTTFRRN